MKKLILFFLVFTSISINAMDLSQSNSSALDDYNKALKSNQDAELARQKFEYMIKLKKACDEGDKDACKRYEFLLFAR